MEISSNAKIQAKEPGSEEAFANMGGHSADL
jgi:hypothetical protein